MEVKISVEINKDQLKSILTALARMEGMTELEENDLPYRCAVDYQQAVIGAITTQRYAPYRDYVERYAAWKKKYSTGGFHVLAGDLVRNIKAFKVTGGWMGGITPGAAVGGKSWFYPLGDTRGKVKPIAMYAKVMEFGLAKHPVRAVFGPARDEYASTKWKERGIESHNKVVRNW